MVSTKFVYQNLASRYEEVRKISNPGGQENLSAGLINGIPFSYPESRAEQQAIIDVLAFADEVIDTQSQKVEALKMHKRGLSQRLFVIPAEGTI